MRRCGFSSWLTALTLFCAGPQGLLAQTNQPPKFDEIYQLIRATGSGLTEAEINRAAIKGLLGELKPQVLLVSAGTNDAGSSNLLRKISVLENAFGYFRLSEIENGLNDAFKSAYQKLLSTNKLKGLVLDLRSASGTDYGAAAKTADLFIKEEQSLLRWGDASASSTTKTNAIAVPVVVLVNHQTSGAAEALAAILHEAKVGLVIGTNTAGQASVFKEFALSNGQRLKVATTPVVLGNGKQISAEGLSPDIEVAVNSEDEKAFIENPYRTTPRQPALVASTANAPGISDTNRPRRRLNEAELVRLQREGLAPDQEFSPREPASSRAALAPNAPGLSDPVMVRAIDLLKGLSVMQPQAESHR